MQLWVHTRSPRNHLMPRLLLLILMLMLMMMTMKKKMMMMMLMGHDGGGSAAAGGSALGGSGADEDDDIGEPKQLLLSSLSLWSPLCSSCPRSLLLLRLPATGFRGFWKPQIVEAASLISSQFGLKLI